MKETELNNENLNPGESNQDANQSPYTPQELVRAKTLCIISLALLVIAYIFGVLFIITSDEFAIAFSEVLSVIKPVTIVGLVLLVVCMSKYPKYRFAKVVMVIYIIVCLVELICYICNTGYLVISCLNACTSIG